jgi:hypothetical protein
MLRLAQVFHKRASEKRETAGNQCATVLEDHTQDLTGFFAEPALKTPSFSEKTPKI